MMTSANNVGEGWHPIIRTLEEILNVLDPDYELQQVKEKFGGLRYYAQLSSPALVGLFEQFHAAIDDAEQESLRTCEMCGNPGSQRGGGWIKTLCDRHAEERSDRDQAQVPRL